MGLSISQGGGGGGGSTPTGSGFRRVTAGVEEAASAAVNLAGGATHVTGLLPLTNQAAPSGTGVVKGTAGAWDAATSLVANADVSATAAIAATKIAPPGSASEILINSATTALGAATNITAGSGFIGFGAGTLATVGFMRRAYAATDVILAVKDSAAVDREVVSRYAADSVQFGPTTASAMNTDVRGAAVSVFANGTLTLFGGATQCASTNGTLWTQSVPRVGNNTAYASEGEGTHPIAGNATLAASVYSRRIVALTGTSPSAAMLTFPLPANADQSYEKIIDAQFTGAATMTLSVGTGSTASITAGQKGVFVFRPGGVTKIAP